MARFEFGGVMAAWVVSYATAVDTSSAQIRAVTLLSEAMALPLYDAPGGAEVTDFIDENGQPVTQITVSPDSPYVPRFSGPDGVTSLWTQADGGRWIPIPRWCDGSETYADQGTFDELEARYNERETTTITPEAMLQAEFRRSKGYAIGTSGRAAVALRFDHWLNAFGATILPLLRARDIPAGLCVYSRMLTSGDTYWDADSANYAWSDVESWCVKDGIEIWSHSRSHADTPHTEGFAGLVGEIVGSKGDLEGFMPKVKVQGWMMPGVTLAPGVTLPYIDFDTTNPASMWTTNAGRLLRQTYPVAEVYMSGYMRTLPTGPIHGADHYTLDDHNIAELQVILDDAISLGVGIEFMAHPGLIGGAGHITLADFTAFLDYIVTKRSAGLLEVVTPSGLYLADKERKGRAELVTGGDFAPPFNPTTNRGRWSTHVSGMTLMTDTDGTTKFLRIPTTSTILNQANTQVGRLGFSGETFMAEVKVRQVAGAAVTARLQVEDTADITRWQDNYTLAVPAGTGWTTWRQLFTVPKPTTSFRLYAGRSSGGELDITGIRAYKV